MRRCETEHRLQAFRADGHRRPGCSRQKSHSRPNSRTWRRGPGVHCSSSAARSGVNRRRIRKSSCDRRRARARSDRAPRRSSAARRGRVIATGGPLAPCRGHVPGRRQPPALCGRAAETGEGNAPANRSIAPCVRSRSRTVLPWCGSPRAGRAASARRRLPAARADRSNRVHRLANDSRGGPRGTGISMSVRNPSTKRLPTCGPSQRSGTYSGDGPPSKGMPGGIEDAAL
jgi:hypothetical protein